MLDVGSPSRERYLVNSWNYGSGAEKGILVILYVEEIWLKP